MRRIALVLAALVLAALPAAAQQVADPNPDLSIARPAFAKGAGPKVVIDGGHANFHTVDGRFSPFAALVRADGFTVEGREGPLTADALAGVKVLVIANPTHPTNVEEWKRPILSAFSREEIAAVKAWVSEGGSLLLIADHMPFAGAAKDLGAAFGFSFSDGFAQLKTGGGPDLFTRETGLAASIVTDGRGPEERVEVIRTFTGSAFRAPAEATPVIVLPQGAVSLEPEVAWQFGEDTPKVAVGGWLQGATLKVGKGRVAVFGEAAMFSAQLAGPNKTPMGFNAPDARDNRKLILNVVRWLAGVL